MRRTTRIALKHERQNAEVVQLPPRKVNGTESYKGRHNVDRRSPAILLFLNETILQAREQVHFGQIYNFPTGIV